MLGHKKGTESAALSLSKKRGPDERKDVEGPSNKQHREEQACQHIQNSWQG